MLANWYLLQKAMLNKQQESLPKVKKIKSKESSRRFSGIFCEIDD